MHRTADGYEIHEGDTFWDNNLDLVTITKVASYPEENRNPSHPDFGQVTWWHDTTKGMSDGSRLVKFHTFTREEAQPAPRIYVTLACPQEGRDVPVVAENAGPYPSVEAALADRPGWHVATEAEYAAYVAYWDKQYEDTPDA